MNKNSYLGNSDICALGEMYQQYLKDPHSVEDGWQKFFEGFEFAQQNFDTETQ